MQAADHELNIPEYDASHAVLHRVAERASIQRGDRRPADHGFRKVQSEGFPSRAR